MRNSIKKTIVLLIAAIALLASCADPLQDPNNSKGMTQVPSAILCTGKKPAAQTRTMLPSDLTAPSFYNIKLIPVVEGPQPAKKPADITITNATPNPEGNIELMNIPAGKYKVEADGLDQNKQRIYHGSSRQDELLIVENKGIAAVMNIELHTLFEPNTTGSLSVTFDWQDTLAAANNSRSLSLDLEGTSLSARGPFTDVLADPDCKLTVELYLGDTPDALEKYPQTVTWTKATGDPKGITCTFTDIPVTKGKFAAFSIIYEHVTGNPSEEHRYILLDKEFLTIVQIYTNQTSYWDGNKDTILNLGKYNSWFKNVYNLTYRYPLTATDTTLYLDWQDLQKNGKSLYDRIEFTYGKIDAPDSVAKKTVYPARDNVTSVLLDNMAPDTEYFVRTQAFSSDGKASAIKEWKMDDVHGFMTKKEVTDIVVEGSVTADMVVGDTFKISAHILPENASYNTLKWTSENEGVLIVSEASALDTNATIYANHPGKTHLVVSNLDPNPSAPNSSKTIPTEITVILNTPTDVSALLSATPEAAEGITVSWAPVTQAESYEILRKVGTADAEFKHLADVSGSTSYVDNDLLTGETYTYKVIAKAPSYDAEGFKADSASSAPSQAITMPKPQITLKPTTAPDMPFNVTGTAIVDFSGIPTIVIEGKETTTLEITPEPGAEYTWIFNKQTIKSNATTFTFDMNSPFINNEMEKGIQTLTIVASQTDGSMWSKTIQISIVTDPVTGITTTGNTQPSGSYLSMDEKNHAFKATVVPAAASNQTVIYRVASPEMSEIAEITPNGKITVKKPGTVTFTAASEENPEATVSATYTFFQPTFTSQKDLISKVNAELQKHIAAADQKIGDWFPPAGADAFKVHQQTYDGTDGATGKIRIQSAKGGTTSYTHDYTDPGTITFTDYKLSDGTIINGKLILSTTSPNSYLGTQKLKYIGIGSEADNKLTLTLPNTQGTATIIYEKVNVTQKNDGTYRMNFTNKLPLANGELVGDNIDVYAGADLADIANPVLK